MNHKLKLAVTAAIAVMGLSTQAHALTPSTVNTSGSLFLYAFEDRQANPQATNSAVFDLGLASAFDPAANHTFDFSTNSAWNTYIATIATPANIHWGVFGSAYGNSGAGTTLLMTESVKPPAGTLNGAAVSTATINYNQEISQTYGEACSTCGFSVVTTNDMASPMFDDNAGITPSTLTTGLNGSIDFIKYVSTGTKSSSLATRTAFATGGDADYFKLSNTGVLTYTATAAVPEASTYGMMAAGLGLVGFMVRRRKAV